LRMEKEIVKVSLCNPFGMDVSVSTCGLLLDAKCLNRKTLTLYWAYVSKHLTLNFFRACDIA